MQQLGNSDVLIVGLGGLGVEIAKNLILNGVKSLTLIDTKSTRYSDLSSQCFLSEAYVGMNRAEACRDELAELNRYVPIYVLAEGYMEEIILDYQVVILTDTELGEQIRICDLAHSKNIKIIVANTFGLFGQIFCDFGENFTVSDATGEEPLSVGVTSISRDNQGLVITLGKEGHGFEDGDYVQFSDVEGMTELNDGEPYKIRVLGRFMFSIGNTSYFSPYKRGGVATQVKTQKTVDFQTFSDSLSSPKFVTTDLAKVDRQQQLHLAFQALHAFHERLSRVPKAGVAEDTEKFLQICNVLKMDSKLDEQLMIKFANTCCGNLAPINSIIGGIAAQEVIKACIHKYRPISQWLYFDALECLPKDWNPTMEDTAPLQSRYDGQISVFGRTFQETLQKQRLLIVGAGAVGCELLKNFALMGIGCTDSGGEIVVSDKDRIERLNLNGQFLFRPYHMYQRKVAVAARIIKFMNPDLNMIPNKNRVSPNTEEIYDEAFFDRLDGIVNTWDNNDSRNYITCRCIFHRKPLLDMGTLGPKGNTQVLVPFLTDSVMWSTESSRNKFPINKLKSFPHEIDHTLHWAVDLFEALFEQGPENAVQYLEDPGFVNRTLRMEDVQPLLLLESVLKTLVKDRPRTIEDCVAWARMHWEEQFHNRILDLVSNFPPNHLDETGRPFWWPPKKFPHPLVFNLNDPLHVDYVFIAANLKAEVYRIPQNRDRAAIIQMIRGVKVPTYTPLSSAERNVISDLLSDLDFESSNDDNHFDSFISISSQMPSPEDWLRDNVIIRPLHIEIEDDTNLHMDFIMTASTLRAANYNIMPVNRMICKSIVNKIVPSMPTTASLVAGLICLELIKLAQGFRTRNLFKNGHFNLGLSTFGFSEPLAAPRRRYNDTEWTLWDRFDIQGELTLEQFLHYFEEEFDLQVLYLSQGNYILYMLFMGQSEIEQIARLPMSQIARQVSKKEVKPYMRSLVFRLICIDRKGVDTSVPYVRYVLPPNNPS